MFIRVGLFILEKLTKKLLPTQSAVSTTTLILSNMMGVITVKLDSGDTCHYFKQEHQHILNDLKKLHNGPVAQLTNNSLV